MAKKKENKLSYLQMPLPNGRKHYKMTKRSWSGLDYRNTIDSGAMSMERNISTLDAPYLTPSQRRTAHPLGLQYENPVGLFGFGDFLLVIYYDNDLYMWVDYIKRVSTNGWVVYEKGCLSIPTEETKEADCKKQRCVVPFNLYDAPTDPIEGEYVKRLLIFPDKKAMDFNITKDYFNIDSLDVEIKEYSNETPEKDENGNTIYPPPETADTNCYYRNTANIPETNYGTDVYKYEEYDTEDGGTAYGWHVVIPPNVPDIDYATVHLSRVFGVGNGRIYASGYNDYSNWNLDTAGEYNEANAWCSPAQSNTKAGGDFTGITVFLNHVICFKRDFMHELYNNKNPFRIQDIYADGATDNRTIQDVGGKLIFVSGDDVKIYTGSKPRSIGQPLGVKSFRNAVSGSDGRCYYLFCYDENTEKRLFVYDTLIGHWSEQAIDDEVISFVHNTDGAAFESEGVSDSMYMLCSDGQIYKMDSGRYDHEWSFETDLITSETVDIKHIKKIQMLADISNDASLKAYILYGDEEFDEDTSHLVYQSNGFGLKPVRVKPRQTASYGIKLHIEGTGYVKLYELELFMEQGGNLYV